jgi:hypothetical protein
MAAIQRLSLSAPLPYEGPARREQARVFRTNSWGAPGPPSPTCCYFRLAHASFQCILPRRQGPPRLAQASPVASSSRQLRSMQSADLGAWVGHATRFRRLGREEGPAKSRETTSSSSEGISYAVATAYNDDRTLGTLYKQARGWGLRKCSANCSEVVETHPGRTLDLFSVAAAATCRN